MKCSINGLVVMLSALMVMGCMDLPESDPDSDCAVGSEGCACTGAGECDPGLVCRSEVCMDRGEGDDPGSYGEQGDDEDPDSSRRGYTDSDVDSDSDSDSDSDADSDSDSDSDGDGDTETGIYDPYDVTLDPDVQLGAQCANIDLMGLMSLGSYGTCQKRPKDCNAGVQADMEEAIVALAGGMGGMVAGMIGAPCAGGITCCMNENACESLSASVGGVLSMAGPILGADAGVAQMACQNEPCAGEVSSRPWGCPNGGYCCATGAPDAGL